MEIIREECPICMFPLDKEDLEENPIFSLECNHTFHTKCIIQSLRRNPCCPYCRNNPATDVMPVQEWGGSSEENEDILYQAQSQLTWQQTKALSDKIINLPVMLKYKQRLRKAVNDLKKKKIQIEKLLKPIFTEALEEAFCYFEYKSQLKELLSAKQSYSRKWKIEANKENPELAKSINNWHKFPKGTRKYTIRNMRSHAKHFFFHYEVKNRRQKIDPPAQQHELTTDQPHQEIH